MAHWDHEKQKIVYRKPKQSKDYPGWDILDCGCCAGIKWGGEEPIECDACNASGIIWKHRKSGVTAKWPGGPFTG